MKSLGVHSLEHTFEGKKRKIKEGNFLSDLLGTVQNISVLCSTIYMKTMTNKSKKNSNERTNENTAFQPLQSDTRLTQEAEAMNASNSGGALLTARRSRTTYRCRALTLSVLNHRSGGHVEPDGSG